MSNWSTESVFLSLSSNKIHGFTLEEVWSRRLQTDCFRRLCLGLAGFFRIKCSLRMFLLMWRLVLFKGFKVYLYQRVLNIWVVLKPVTVVSSGSSIKRHLFVNTFKCLFRSLWPWFQNDFSCYRFYLLMFCFVFVFLESFFFLYCITGVHYICQCLDFLFKRKHVIIGCKPFSNLRKIRKKLPES